MKGFGRVWQRRYDLRPVATPAARWFFLSNLLQCTQPGLSRTVTHITLEERGHEFIIGIMIQTRTKYFAPSDDSLPALVLQQTVLVDSYMLWIAPTDKKPEEAEQVPLTSRLCADWACAMPPASESVRL